MGQKHWDAVRAQVPTRQDWSLALALAGVLGGCGGDPVLQVAYHAGETIDCPGADDSFRLGAPVGAATTTTSMLEFDPGSRVRAGWIWGDVEIRIEVEHGAVRLEGRQTTVDIPRRIRVFAEDLAGFDLLTASCWRGHLLCSRLETLGGNSPEDGSEAQHSVGARPELRRSCHATVTRSENSAGFAFAVRGDGTVIANAPVEQSVKVSQ